MIQRYVCSMAHQHLFAEEWIGINTATRLQLKAVSFSTPQSPVLPDARWWGGGSGMAKSRRVDSPETILHASTLLLHQLHVSLLHPHREFEWLIIELHTGIIITRFAGETNNQSVAEHTY